MSESGDEEPRYGMSCSGSSGDEDSMVRSI